ncbi:cobalamin-dependent protein [Actinokineospora sp. NBRC 105648]|uniref:cobalamin B12-binding domain-containing protein n=1 Tax=Actinokineospora sp. NBRC 105648 TaxID=3032206 RepID=UPI0024A1AC41|nr:cobalamin-dependent protein [Actinokineospora sp. NBRC 105648]GLZ37982.1 methylaspartate mutase [Actinokineospora sp. NBRC 105648]
MSPLSGEPVVISGTSSDSHTWNLVYLQLLVREIGHPVLNLGPCVPDDLLVAECARARPRLVVISTVNGHGFTDAVRVAPRLRARPELAGTPLVIGGKLGIHGDDGTAAARRDQLLAAGFDRVYAETELAAFADDLAQLRARVAS